ncbi:MAG: molybdenum cofactor guanylyltransferase [bacterium]
MTDSIEAFILAGGASSRMGTDKSRLLLDGQSFIHRIATKLSAVMPLVTIVGHLPDDAGLIFPSTPDVYKEWGALGGVHAALSACRSEWAVIVACDLPFVTAELFNRLAGLRDDFEAVAPVQNDGRRQPLCAFYRTAPSLVSAEALIKTGERKPVALLQSLHTRWVPFAALADLAGAADFFDNINTPQDFARVTQKGELDKNRAE